MANNKDFKVKNGIKPTVYHEGVGTVVSGSEAYSLATASYDSVSFTPSPAINSIGLAFKTDGTKMYTLDLTGASIEQYSLSTAFDITTATKDSKTFSVSSQDSSPYEIEFSPDGTKLFALGTTNDTVYQYSLSTAWDVSTASYDSVSFSVASQATQPYGMGFKSDGTALYVLDYNTNNVFQYTLSTAWDVSTLSYSSKSLSVASESTRGYGLGISPDGNKVFVGDDLVDAVFEYTLSTAWDISTGTYSGNSLSVASQGQVATSIRFNGDGTKMITTGFRDDVVYQYSTVQTTATLDLSTGSVFEITPTSDIQIGLSNPAASGTVSAATLLLDGAVNGYDLSGAAYDNVSVATASARPFGLGFSSDGTKMYICDDEYNGVLGIIQKSLSTAWDVSTASANGSLDVSAKDIDPGDISFKSDGTVMFFVGDSSNSVHAYTLSTAWDVTTATFSQSFSLSSQGVDPRGLDFKPDGTAMYTVDIGTDTVYQYSLSTAWDLSTASYASKSFVVSSTGAPTGNTYKFKLNGDGTKGFVLLPDNQAVHQFSFSTAYDISTVSYDNVSFSLSSQATDMFGLAFKPDGTKMYTVSFTTDTVYQYTTGSAYTVTYDSTLQWAGGTAPDSPLANETDVLTFTTRDGGTTYQAAIAIDGAA